KVNAAFDEAAKINVAFDSARADTAQARFNTDYAPGLARDAAEQARRRADAEAAILPLLQRQEREYEQMLALAYQINNARDLQITENAQARFNADYAPGLGQRSASYLAEQRRVVAALQEQVAAEQV